MRAFCQGAPTCSVCGAPHAEGVVQMCPARLSATRGAIVVSKPAGPAVGLYHWPQADCMHLLEPLAEDVEQLACGCPGARLTSVWGCELHERCAPLARVGTLADETVRACCVCPDKKSAADVRQSPA